MAADLLDEGIDDGTAPAGFLGSDEHPILRAEFGGADRSFGVVVVKLDLSVEEARFKVLPLVAGVAERFPKLAFGKDTAVFFEMMEEFSEMVVEGQEPVGEVVVPVAHVVAGEINAVGGFEFPLLAVEGAVIAKFLGEKIGSE